MASPEVLDARVARLRALMDERGYDAVVVRNVADLRWLTGCERTFDDERAHVAFVTPKRMVLHSDSRYIGTFRERLGEDGPWELDGEAVSAPAWIASQTLRSRSRVLAIEDTWSLGFYERVVRALDEASLAVSLPRLHGDLMRLREVKDESELEVMRAAQRITDAAFDHICAYIREGMTEVQIARELESHMMSEGADGLAFETIVAAGPNGANPHAKPGDYRVRRGDAIVMDYGASLRDYRSDMTRTVVVGEPSDELRHVYDVVLRANRECAAAIRAGVSGADMHALAVRIISEAGYGDCFGHGLGHGVGIDIHELPHLGRLSSGALLAGSVVTDEPGIYLPGRFGVRIEDCGVVTEDGYEPFTGSTHRLISVG